MWSVVIYLTVNSGSKMLAEKNKHWLLIERFLSWMKGNIRCPWQKNDASARLFCFIEALRQFMKRRIQWKEWFPLSSLMGACLISACQLQVEKEQEIIVRGNLKSKRRRGAKNFVGFHPPCLLSPPLVSVWPPPKLSVCTLHRLHNCASTIHQTFGQTKLMTGRLK